MPPAPRPGGPPVSRYYTLKDRRPVPTDDAGWWRIFEDYGARRVARDQIGPGEVSTVFVGLNLGFHRDGQPLLFETTIFCSALPDLDGTHTRYLTWEEAEEGHRRVVEQVREALGVEPDAVVED
jgi:hypothetical protein